MEHTAEGTFDWKSHVRCAGCGALDTPTAPLPWTYGRTELDLYCDACYRQHRRYEEAEEAVVAAIRNAKLHETYTAKHLIEALDSISSYDEEWFSLTVNEGRAYGWERRAAVAGLSIAEDSNSGAEGGRQVS